MRLQLAIAIALSAAAHAGSVNLVNLVVRDATRFTFTQGAAAETFELPAGSSSGKFQSDSDTVIRCLEVPGAETTISSKEGNVFVVFHETSGKPEWRILPSKPTEGTLSLRILNLGKEAVIIQHNKADLEIPADATSDLAVKGKGGMSISIEGGEKFSYDGSEPCAVLAIIYVKEGERKVLFVPDR